MRCGVVVELAGETRGMIQSLSSGYKPTKQTTHNDSTAPNGYKRADRIQFGKSAANPGGVQGVRTPPFLIRAPFLKRTVSINITGNA